MLRCFQCDQVGHKAWECKSNIQEVEANNREEVEQCAVEIRGVWNLAQVEVSNRFGELEDEEEEVGRPGLEDSESEEVEAPPTDGGVPEAWRRMEESEEEETPAEIQSLLMPMRRYLFVHSCMHTHIHHQTFYH